MEGKLREDKVDCVQLYCLTTPAFVKLLAGRKSNLQQVSSESNVLLRLFPYSILLWNCSVLIIICDGEFVKVVFTVNPCVCVQRGDFVNGHD